ncbi:MAG: hypothetical protein ACX932_05555 [Gammaproteobacteria bacterium]
MPHFDLMGATIFFYRLQLWALFAEKTYSSSLQWLYQQGVQPLFDILNDIKKLKRPYYHPLQMIRQLAYPLTGFFNLANAVLQLSGFLLFGLINLALAAVFSLMCMSHCALELLVFYPFSRWLLNDKNAFSSSLSHIKHMGKLYLAPWKNLLLTIILMPIQCLALSLRGIAQLLVTPLMVLAIPFQWFNTLKARSGRHKNRYQLISTMTSLSYLVEQINNKDLIVLKKAVEKAEYYSDECFFNINLLLQDAKKFKLSANDMRIIISSLKFLNYEKINAAVIYYGYCYGAIRKKINTIEGIKEYIEFIQLLSGKLDGKFTPTFFYKARSREIIKKNPAIFYEMFQIINRLKKHPACLSCSFDAFELIKKVTTGSILNLTRVDMTAISSAGFFMFNDERDINSVFWALKRLELIKKSDYKNASFIENFYFKISFMQFLTSNNPIENYRKEFSQLINTLYEKQNNNEEECERFWKLQTIISHRNNIKKSAYLSALNAFLNKSNTSIMEALDDFNEAVNFGLHATEPQSLIDIALWLQDRKNKKSSDYNDIFKLKKIIDKNNLSYKFFLKFSFSIKEDSNDTLTLARFFHFIFGKINFDASKTIVEQENFDMCVNVFFEEDKGNIFNQLLDFFPGKERLGLIQYMRKASEYFNFQEILSLFSAIKLGNDVEVENKWLQLFFVYPSEFDVIKCYWEEYSSACDMLDLISILSYSKNIVDNEALPDFKCLLACINTIVQQLNTMEDNNIDGYYEAKRLVEKLRDYHFYINDKNKNDALAQVIACNIDSKEALLTFIDLPEKLLIFAKSLDYFIDFYAKQFHEPSVSKSIKIIVESLAVLPECLLSYLKRTLIEYQHLRREQVNRLNNFLEKLFFSCCPQSDAAMEAMEIIVQINEISQRIYRGNTGELLPHRDNLMDHVLTIFLERPSWMFLLNSFLVFFVEQYIDKHEVMQLNCQNINNLLSDFKGAFGRNAFTDSDYQILRDAIIAYIVHNGINNHYGLFKLQPFLWLLLDIFQCANRKTELVHLLNCGNNEWIKNYFQTIFHDLKVANLSEELANYIAHAQNSHEVYTETSAKSSLERLYKRYGLTKNGKKAIYPAVAIKEYQAFLESLSDDEYPLMSEKNGQRVPLKKFKRIIANAMNGIDQDKDRFGFSHIKLSGGIDLKLREAFALIWQAANDISPDVLPVLVKEAYPGLFNENSLVDEETKKAIRRELIKTRRINLLQGLYTGGTAYGDEGTAYTQACITGMYECLLQSLEYAHKDIVIVRTQLSLDASLKETIKEWFVTYLEKSLNDGTAEEKQRIKAMITNWGTEKKVTVAGTEYCTFWTPDEELFDNEVVLSQLNEYLLYRFSSLIEGNHLSLDTLKAYLDNLASLMPKSPLPLYELQGEKKNEKAEESGDETDAIDVISGGEKKRDNQATSTFFSEIEDHEEQEPPVVSVPVPH